MSKMLKVVGASWVQTRISSYVLAALGLLAILALFLGQMERTQEDGTYAATVFHSAKTGYRIEYWGQSNELAAVPRGVARAYFRTDVDAVGWSTLEVETDGSYPDDVQAYAAGIAEGALTWYLIHTHLENTVRRQCGDQPALCDRVRAALDRAGAVWKAHAAERQDDPFWHHVSLYYTQINGVYTGWQHGVERSLSELRTDISELYWLNSYQEVRELQRRLNASVQEDPPGLPPMASAFVKIAGDKMFVAHNAAGSYSTMTRILKRYKLNYHRSASEPEPSPTSTVDFSGYPGAVTSQDEFYLLRGGRHLAVTGTAIANYDHQLWKDVNITEQVPLGPRVTAANHLATNVSSWAHLLAASNSGTGCKQWLVVDFNNFRANLTGERIDNKDDVTTQITIHGRHKHTVVHRGRRGGRRLAWLLEQAPGRTHSADVSDLLLARGYLATVGLPLFQDISDITHTTELKKRYKVFSESESPRAKGFERGQRNATTLERVLGLMRDINVTSLKNPDEDCLTTECLLQDDSYWSAAGLRGDLLPHLNEAYGVIDTKVIVATANGSTLEFIGVSSPPFTKENNTTRTNKGNVASTYTDQFDNEPLADSEDLRDLVKQQQEEADQELQDCLDRQTVQPFQWSESRSDQPHHNLPDKWDFEPFRPKWYW